MSSVQNTKTHVEHFAQNLKKMPPTLLADKSASMVR